MCYLPTLSLAKIIPRNVSYEGMDVYDTDGGKVKHSEVSKCHFAYHKSHIYLPAADPWPHTPPDTWYSLLLSHPLILCLFFHFLVYIFTPFLLWFINHAIPSFRSHFRLSPLLSEHPLWTQRSADFELGSSEALKFGTVWYSILCAGCISFLATTPPFL